MVDVHVGEPPRDVVRPRTHLLVRDDFELDLVAGVPDGGVETGERPVQVLVDPPVAEGAVVAGTAHDRGELAAQEGHFLQRRADYARACVLVLLREPVPPDVRGSTVWSSTEMIFGKAERVREVSIRLTVALI
ncbi:hypothetical protein SAV31267_055580 [Streptomyces avermitilis]|uniref:Uncharacterized protein n=1 Tax=Streptomyces avermitilis TaxID=33903 RepID=A0A4D4MVB1_STRAX|nr:hypothetical protein SAV31267_055580 [Streptomyces avermitilis]